MSKYLYLVFLLLFPVMLTGEIFYVSASGDDNNNGSSYDKAFKTIAKGIVRAQAKDTVLIKEGAYYEKDTRIDKPGPILIKAEGKVVLDCGKGRGFIFDNASKIEIDGLEIKNYTAGLQFGSKNNGARNITIRNCSIHDGGNGFGGWDGSVSDILLENLDVYNNTNCGGDFTIPNGSITNLTVRKCKIHDNLCKGGNDGFGIGHKGSKSGIRIINCEVYNNNSDGIDIDADGTVIDGCIVYNNGIPGEGTPSWGVGIKVWKDSKIINCVLYHNGYGKDGNPGISIAGPNCLVANCVISDSQDAGIVTGGSVKLVNNIFYKERTAVRADGNGSYNMDSTNIEFYCESETSEKSLKVDPKFVNPPSDFHLKAGSPAIDAGIKVDKVATDAEGVNRPQGKNFDIGAYEFKE